VFVVRAVIQRASRSWCGANVNGKKKVLEKQRRSNNMDRREKCFFCRHVGVLIFGWQGK
jgi:hypothetical protein